MIAEDGPGKGSSKAKGEAEEEEDEKEEDEDGDGERLEEEESGESEESEEQSEESYSGDDTDDTSHSSTVGHGNNAVEVGLGGAAASVSNTFIPFPTSPIVKDERLTVCVKGGTGLAQRRQSAFLV